MLMPSSASATNGSRLARSEPASGLGIMAPCALVPVTHDSRHAALYARVGGSHQAFFLAFTSFFCVSITCWRFSAHTSSPSSTGHSSLPRGVRLYSTFGKELCHVLEGLLVWAEKRQQ